MVQSRPAKKMKPRTGPSGRGSLPDVVVEKEMDLGQYLSPRRDHPQHRLLQELDYIYFDCICPILVFEN